MAKRFRTCPLTGVPLQGVDERWLSVDAHSLDIAELKKEFPDCDVFGLKQIADQIFTTSSQRSVKYRLGLRPGMTPSSYYHLHQRPLGEMSESGEYGVEPVLFATHTNSLQAGNVFYDADVVARRTADRSGLRRRNW